MRLRFLLLAPLAALPLHAQFWATLANPTVKVRLLRPPDAGVPVHRAAVLPAPGDDSHELSDRILADLADVPGVEVVGRDRIARALQGVGLASGAAPDPGQAKQLGKEVGSGILLWVSAARREAKYVPTQKEEKDSGGKVKVTRTLTATLEVTATFQILDLGTGARIREEILREAPTLSASSDLGDPQPPSEIELRRLAFARFRDRVMTLLFPWEDVQEVTFFDDREYDLKACHQALKAGDLPGALARAQASAGQARKDPEGKPKYRARACYNLGIVHLLRQEAAEALPLLQEALGIQPDAGIFKDGRDLASRALQWQEALKAFRREPRAREPEPSESRSVEARLDALERLYQKGLVTAEEYRAKRTEILKGL